MADDSSTERPAMTDTAPPECLDDEPSAAPPSKSQVKREAEALQALGEALVKLPDAQWRRIEVPDALREAVDACRRIRQNGALRRQKQYIGKLMRSIDAAPIQAQLDAFAGVSALDNARLHQAERWRDRLLADDAALTEWLATQGAQGGTELRQLIRQAREEARQGKPPRAARLLFRALRDTLAGA